MPNYTYWDETKVKLPPKNQKHQGHQIIHFNSEDKPFHHDVSSKIFVETYLKNSERYDVDAELIRVASDAVSLDGLFLEMGVCTGFSINLIAGLNPRKIIYGFDSFEGLPENWVRGDVIIEKGTFALRSTQMLPPTLHNVTLHKGWFKDSLPSFAKDHQEPIAFLHMDADLYSSTKEVFEHLGNRCLPGTIILFDELYNYPGFEQHEWKAFNEFLTSRADLEVEYIAFNQNHEQVVCRLVSSEKA